MTTIPFNLIPNPNYTGTKVLDGNNYSIRVRWNVHTEKWYMDLKGLNNSVDIRGMALLGGKDLLAPYGYLSLGELWLIDNSGANEDPNFADIGGRFTLEYTPKE